MGFEWDKNKNDSNIEKHGIDFNDAKNVFNDDKRKISPDLRSNYGEDRWITIGKVVDTIMVVIYTIRNKAYRLISARYAKKKERDRYNK
ncbi:MAG: hypothetical protein B6I20_13055 [Bacteroidetes bacterium 4572_117]|nr:MAG: hypothetical protein B6I20_13055 [Bacteroidetes bacterium 4572_117]